MYQPPHHREDRLEIQHALIRAHPLGLLVSHGPDGLAANQVPFLLDAEASALGTLAGHLARANDQWRHLDGAEALIVFQGPAAYVTPAWYETKRETGKVVPTWNYATVQARGRVRVIEDQDWLAAQVARLTGEQEAGRPEPWAVGDAPAGYVAAMLRGIVGIEIAVTAIEGKWKVSQNRSAGDRRGVADGLAASSDSGAVAMARLVEDFGGG